MNQRVAIYARYSSENQREASIDDQLRICRARAEREGWTVVGEFSDAAISGTKDKRPGFIALRDAARGGECDVILAESLDRFSRDLEHVAAFYKQVTFCRVKLVTLAEGEISDLHVGVKGAMGALYLKDLAAKTHRGLEGSLRKGHCITTPAYGYRVVRRIGADGELERGLREIVPEHARIVRRIFEDYVAGRSPLAIARRLNEEGVPSPTGRDWLDGTIRGRPGRGDGILRNPAYTGRAVWNRTRRETDPVTGASVHRPKPAASFVEAVFPELRIVSDELWQAAQTRLAAEAVATHPAGRQAFWERRRPKHLLTGKVACGCCGGAFSLLGKDYLGCSRAKNAGSCRNTTRVRRSVLERQVLAALGNSLMRPEALEAFCDAFIAEWNRMAAEMSLGARAKQDELKVIERKIANLVVAIEDGLADPGVKQRLEELRARQQVLGDQDGTTMPAPPALHPNLAHVYAKRVAALREALDAGDGEEVLEAARDLIETVVISPPDIPGDPPGIELAGNLMAMLKAGGVNISAGESTFGSCLTAMLAGSTKGEVREKFPSPPDLSMSTIYAILLPAPADLDAWRLAARRMLAAGLPPAQIDWRVAGDDGALFGETPPEHAPSTARVPRAFIDLAAVAIRHRDAARFALLYRLLWRITHGEPDLLRIPTDPDVLRAEAMAKSVRRDAHKMHAFLRFREVLQPDGPRFVAWFEPEHHIEEAEAGFFVRRFAALRFSIVTPRRSIHWDGEDLSFGPGGHRRDVPAEDATEDLWRAYFAAIFNPARLKPAAMRAEMPKKYWRNMPEAADIPRLIAEAPARVREMVARGATPPTPAPQRPRLLAAESGQRAAEARPAPRDAREAALAALRARLLADATLPLAEAATQAVFGEGPVDAPLMLVGEQPGDEEDLAGRPFVGPAGRLLDAALAEARIDRARLYVTNAVKHFKYAPQGRRRLHQRPDTGDIARYRPFLLEEIALVRPRIVLAMGVSAGQALTGDARVTLSSLRGATHELRCGTPMRATVHPAYLLRLPQGEGQRRERAMFVEDLSDAAAYAGISASGR